MKHLTVRRGLFFFLCLGWQQAGLYAQITIYSPPVTVTMARRGRAPSTGKKSSSAAATSRRRHGDHGPSQPASQPASARARLHRASDMPEGATRRCAFLPPPQLASQVSAPAPVVNHGSAPFPISRHPSASDMPRNFFFSPAGTLASAASRLASLIRSISGRPAAKTAVQSFQGHLLD